MNRRLLLAVAVVLVLAAAIVGISIRQKRRVAQQPYKLAGAALAEFTSLEPIDAHVHIFQNSADLVALFQRLHMHVLDILYVDDRTPLLKNLESERSVAQSFIVASNGQARLCTTFDPFQIHQSDFAKTAITQLNQDFAAGAVAAKVWKNIGMEILNSSGKYVMPDDPALEPIYKDIAAQGKTLIIHAAEPDEAWGLNPSGAYRKYYEMNPEWDMSAKPNAPRKEDILAARDHVLALYPDLRVVGAHFGSMEDHLDQVAARLDRYPNFAVDTAARVPRLTYQPRDTVRAFILKYQDRILYGTDRAFMPTNDATSVEGWEQQYARDWHYFATDDRFTYLGHEVEGLNLPQSVLKKLFHDNAVRWIPGIVAAQQQSRAHEQFSHTSNRRHV